MPDWFNPRTVHIFIRVFTGACMSAYVGWNIYKYCKRRIDSGGPTGSQFKRPDGDTIIEEDINHSNPADDNSDSDAESDLDRPDDADSSDDANGGAGDIVDIEDFGADIKAHSRDKNIVKPKHRTHRKSKVVDYSLLTEEQLTDKLRTDLSKQGYRLIESHSAVKICRWTKNSMRGRGGCYKHTFYGIKSYQCMEMTPNLACASKCTFCWRHHKNPVGTEWRWKMDPPDVIVEQALKNHKNMINQLRGLPGVTPERFTEAQTVRHCALSLVGEPIFYPRINELLEILHAQRISTFLVTNAQFPDAMQHLVPVTQLYVSIDAPNKETLKKVDRPLYKDFWQRYLDCLKIISEKKQRTVFRLTLVQKANMEDIDGYAELVRLGRPDFIEIKGVTYCGTSKANKLTMENVPWHEEVVEFAQQLVSRLPENEYELACEHNHSNCTLLASTKFKINNKWYTWIDYEKYFELIERQAEFTSLDYAAPTPSWALFGSEEGGFDPEHRRWIRKEHKLKLLKERIAAQQLNCSSENGNCCKNNESTGLSIELNS